MDSKRQPNVFKTIGNTKEVIQAWRKQIEAEMQNDRQMTGNDLGMFQDGLLEVSATGVGYTKHALRQLFERLGAPNAPRLAAAETAWYLDAANRANVTNEVLARGKSAKTVLVRTAIDAANPEAGRYVRGVVSESHSGQSGDDAELCTSLENAFFNGQFSGFVDGQAEIRRDPAGITTGFFENQSKMAMNAKLTVSVQNSEVGLSSLGAGWALTFDTEIEGETAPIRIDITIQRNGQRKRHVGMAVSRLIGDLKKEYERVAAYAPIAVDRALEMAPVLTKESTLLAQLATSMTEQLDITPEAADKRITDRQTEIRSNYGHNLMSDVLTVASFRDTNLAATMFFEATLDLMPVAVV